MKVKVTDIYNDCHDETYTTHGITKDVLDKFKKEHPHWSVSCGTGYIHVHVHTVTIYGEYIDGKTKYEQDIYDQIINSGARKRVTESYVNTLKSTLVGTIIDVDEYGDITDTQILFV